MNSLESQNAHQEEKGENDVYRAGISQDEVKKIMATPIGKSVAKSAYKAITHGNDRFLEEARETIDKFQFGSNDRLTALLDIFVYKLAEQTAKKAITYANDRYLDDAIKIIGEFGSSEAVISAMEGALDKIVFQLANKLVGKAVTHGNNSYVQDAINVLDQYVTSEVRIADMLQRLGLS